MLSLLITADTSLARCNPSDLNDQTRMEIVISDFKETWKHRFLDANGDFINVCQWRGVRCNPRGDVTQVAWEFAGIHSEIKLSMLPENLTLLNLYSSQIRGELDLSAVPRNFRHAYLGCNLFDSTVQLDTLPASLEWLFANDNRLHGTLSLTQLPRRLQKMDFSVNMFVGTVDLRSLPDSLEELILSQNSLQGVPNLNALPKRLTILRLQKNSFDAVESDAYRPCLKIERQYWSIEWFQ